GNVHAQFVETFHLLAERAARPGHYRVTRVAFDGDAYDNPQKAIMELALGVFHARALDISILMVEQTFNKDDILSPGSKDDIFAPQAQSSEKRDFSFFATRPETPAAAPRKEGFGVVVPFRQRRLAV